MNNQEMDQLSVENYKETNNSIEKKRVVRSIIATRNKLFKTQNTHKSNSERRRSMTIIEQDLPLHVEFKSKLNQSRKETKVTSNKIKKFTFESARNDVLIPKFSYKAFHKRNSIDKLTLFKNNEDLLNQIFLDQATPTIGRKNQSKVSGGTQRKVAFNIYNSEDKNFFSLMNDSNQANFQSNYQNAISRDHSEMIEQEFNLANQRITTHILSKVDSGKRFLPQELDYDTDNSFVKNEVKRTYFDLGLETAKEFLENYKLIKLKNQDPSFYKKLVYLPLSKKFAKIISDKQFNIKKYKNKEEFFKTFKILREQIIRNKKTDKKIIFSDKFLKEYYHLIFEELIKSITKNERNNFAQYKTTKLVFTRLINNLVSNQNITKEKQIYLILKKNLMRICFLKSKNFYLQESLNFEIETLLKEVGGYKKIISLMEEQKSKMALSYKKSLLIKAGNKLTRGVLMPYSSIRLTWDFLIVVCVLYNIISLPLIFINQNQDIYLALSDFIDMTIDGFSFLDIVINFRTGYIDSFNNLVVDLKEIRSYYFKTWFFWDLLSTFPFEILIFNSNVKLTSLVKLPRILRVNRIIKLTEKLNKAMVRLIYLLIIFFLFAHWIGCFIYMTFDYYDILNYFSSEESDYCKTNNILGRSDFKTTCKYFFSLYNGMVILSVQNLSINTSSFYIMIICYILGQMAFSFIFGLISSSLKALDSNEKFYKDKMHIVNNHLDFHKTKGEIRKQINVYYQYLWKRHKYIFFKNDCLFHMTDMLKEKFLVHKYKNIISKLDFLLNIDSDDKLLAYFLRRIRPKIILPYEVIFYEGNVCDGLLIISKGAVSFEVKCVEAKERFKYMFSYPKKNNTNIFVEVDESKSDNYSKSNSLKKNNYVRNKSNKTSKRGTSNFYSLAEAVNTEEDLSNVEFKAYFDIISIFLKSSRHWCTAKSSNFCDLVFIKYKDFMRVLNDHKVVLSNLLKEAQLLEKKFNIFSNKNIFNLVSLPSSRTDKILYKKGNIERNNIWIDDVNIFSKINLPCDIDNIRKSTDHMNNIIQEINEGGIK